MNDQNMKSGVCSSGLIISTVYFFHLIYLIYSQQNFLKDDYAEAGSTLSVNSTELMLGGNKIVRRN